MELCSILRISINEFLAGEDIGTENVIEKSDSNLIQITKESKKKQKNLKTILAVVTVFAVIVSAILGTLFFHKLIHPKNYITAVDQTSTEMKTAELLSGTDGAYLFHYFTKDEFINNKNAVNYFREAYEMKNYIENTTFLRELSTNNIVDINTGASYSNAQDNPYQSISKIFNFSNIESEDSDFNTHRRDVIKYSIERNLSIAISNYNNYSGASVNFQMPKLKETDWDVIMDNISIISFLQGLSIGGKIYNGYSVISNTKNSDVVAEDSIYIKDSYNYLCNVAENGLNSNAVIGIYNINLERKSGESSSGSTQYYYPIIGDFSYDSIVEQNNINDKYNGNIYNYLALAENKNLAKVYYTALARERYGMYRPKIEI